MKIVTKKQQKEIDEMFIKKLKFVARATLQITAQEGYLKLDAIPKDFIKIAEDRAEQVFYVDNVME